MTEKQARATDIVPPEDMKWLRRFAEICEDSDAGGHDLPKTAVKRLEKIGALRSCGFGRHETTEFGDWLLAADPAQAGQVPEGYALIPTRLLLDKGIIESIAYHCGDGGGSYGEYQDGILFVGEITDDEGRQVHGLHLACAECEEEGYTGSSQKTENKAR
ncbi:TPA: hypothetical protein NIF42_006691 [Pseudomonas aeruginosa]|nr:hypothetical protein [Pseudomonas aeruginosa]HCF6284286.1 hypothetical protein [Pseudomonas aeruginosa]HCF6304615.1 hypothetical protein [Pseudomonas aeruginosa]HCF6311311.1 hypothetical protein [Pseudomonas aeruginosa]HCF6352067.1 hypothetical protein [Pseudomonas aeruginosa]